MGIGLEVSLLSLSPCHGAKEALALSGPRRLPKGMMDEEGYSSFRSWRLLICHLFQ